MKKFNLPILGLITVLGLAALFSFTAEKPVKTNAFSDMYVEVWMNAKKMALDVANAMPEDKYGYKPTDVSKTFGTQMVHIAYSASWVTGTYLKGEKKEWAEPKAEGMTKAEIVAMIEKNFDDVAATIKATSDWDTDITTFTGKTLTKAQAINAVQDHITNHRAKANLYIRMNGIDPPKYGYY